MYRIEKTIKVSCMHQLTLDYESPCQRQHGHNYKIKICLKGNKLDKNGMLMDFAHIKRHIDSLIDHDNLNLVMRDNPTAENMCKFLAEEIGQQLGFHNVRNRTNTKVEYVKIWEADDSWAEYYPTYNNEGGINE